MKYVSYKIDLETKQKIENFYEDSKVPNDGDYICFFAKVDNLTITIYESKKGYKVVKEQQVERQNIFLTNYVMEKRK